MKDIELQEEFSSRRDEVEKMKRLKRGEKMDRKAERRRAKNQKRDWVDRPEAA